MQSGVKIIARNKKARHNYEILDTFEAGIVLLGSEVKSLREGRCNLKSAYAYIDRDELFVDHLHISEYKFANRENHNPERTRKLLMHKREIKRLKSKIQEKGFSLIPISVYFKKAKVKLEMALVRGKKLYDKRQDIKKRDSDRDIRRMLKHNR